MPAVEVDGVSTPILHMSQLAALLGIPAPPALESTRLGYDLLLVVESWAENLRALSWELLMAPTSSRGRSLRNLTMNAVYPISLLPETWASGNLDWGVVDLDEQRAESYTTTLELADFARGVHATWAVFMLESEEALALDDPVVRTPRGQLRYSELLASHRWHIAFHHRQMVEYLAAAGIDPAHAFRAEQLAGLTLPATVF
ncbi:MAG: hypothetical protein JWM06_390 [Actinomycetia bacterium]|nr:hypothetical protein [Actinomycetes bacterium]